MPTWKRTTTGLLQGKQSDASMHDLRAAVDVLNARVKDPAQRQALRLDRAEQLVDALFQKRSDQARVILKACAPRYGQRSSV